LFGKHPSDGKNTFFLTRTSYFNVNIVNRLVDVTLILNTFKSKFKQVVYETYDYMSYLQYVFTKDNNI